MEMGNPDHNYPNTTGINLVNGHNIIHLKRFNLAWGKARDQGSHPTLERKALLQR